MNPQSKNKDEWTLTSKLICPPIENVRFRWANFSRSTETIFGRMLWIWYDYKLCCLFQDACYPNTINLLPQTRIDSSIFCFKGSEVYTLSYFSNSSRSSWLQFRPIGDTLSIPLRNSIKVPLKKKLRKRGTYQSKCKLITAIQVSGLLTFLLGYPSRQYNEVWN